jgi:trans-aconitate methyltransferase
MPAQSTPFATGVPNATEAVHLLDEIARHYDPSNPAEQFDYWLKRLQARTVQHWLRGDRVLELGCATGELSSLIAPMCAEYHVVEGSAHNVEAARLRVPDAQFTVSLWEQFEPTTTYSDIVAFNAFEHVSDGVELARMVSRWLQPGGRLHVVVPNGLSLHRLVGVELAMQPDPLTVTDGDRAQGHVKNYTVDSLLGDLRNAGMTLLSWQPIFLKILANRQMLDWDWSLIQALHTVAQRIPEHGAEIYAVAEPG